MIPELKELEPQLKEILYGCVEHIQATKAALYLPVSPDLTEKKYEIVTSYQFNDTSRRMLTGNDDLVDWLIVKRTPFFVNGLGTDQRFAEMMFRQGTDRILAAPLFARGRIIGFIDMRDKAGRKPFEKPDVIAASRIGDEVLALLGEKNLFGLAPIRLVEDVAPEPERRPLPPPVRRPTMETPAPLAPPRIEQRPPASREAMNAIAAARQALARPVQQSIRAVSEHDLELLRLALPSALAMPNLAFAALSLAGSSRLAHSLVAAAPIAPEAAALMARHLRGVLRAESFPLSLPQPSFPFGQQQTTVQAQAITAIQSAPLHAQTLEGVVLTAAFFRISDMDAMRTLQTFVRGLEPIIRGAGSALADGCDRERIAERMLEPDFQRYPELVEHSHEVATAAHRFAVALELSPAQAETVRIAAMVHDIGLRLLDYEQLYRNPDLTAEQMRVLSEHPIVGAALTAPLLGTEVAQAVLRHHERIDGKGYPSRIGGSQIPFAARIIQIVDAWMAMTSPNSYQSAVPRAQAIERLRDGAGTQFDEELVERFVEALPQITR